MFKKGDVVAGLRSANEHYTKTRSGTQWIVYDVEHNNILLDRVVPIEKYKMYQKKYEQLAKDDPEIARMHLGAHWVEAKHFKFVHSPFRDTNEDCLDLLVDDAMSFLIPKEMVR